jgi:hypothetical protein
MQSLLVTSYHLPKIECHMTANLNLDRPQSAQAKYCDNILNRPFPALSGLIQHLSDYLEAVVGA